LVCLLFYPLITVCTIASRCGGQLADLLLWVQDVIQQQDLRCEGKSADINDTAERSSKKWGDSDEDEEGEDKKQEGADRKGPARDALPAVIPYTIEPAESGASISSSTATLLRVRFAVPFEL
jgi:Flp pilus assembly protein TadB